jgi:hypothetical protein
MKIRALTLVVTALAAAPLAAQAQASSDIFMCTDDNGNKVFQNVGSGKGCKRMDVGPVLSVPAPRVQQRASAGGEDRVTVSPASFPRVDRDTQRMRDNDRKRILEDELKAEEDKLARLKAEYNNGEPERRGDERNFALYAERIQRLRDDLARAEGNVNALRRELALLRTQ